jgi:hypothetical protein
MINVTSHNALVKKAKDEIIRSGALDEVRNVYVEKSSMKLAKKINISTSEAAKIVKRSISDNAVLEEDFVLHLATGEEVTVGEVLSNKAKYDKAKLLDPVEPEYHDSKQVAILYLDEQPRIFSFAHGGRTFKLEEGRSRAHILYEQGSAVEVAKKCAVIARKKGAAYRRNNEIVFPQPDGSLIPGRKSVTSFHLSKILQIEIDKGGKVGIVPINMSADIERHIHSNASQLDLDQLNGVITAQTLRNDFTVIDKPGYDKKSGLLFILPANADAVMPIMEKPGIDDAVDALERLLEPFKDFPYADCIDRGVLLAAILTGAIRNTLPTAPGFLFTASTPGSGKTLLAQSIAALCGETEPTIMTADPNDDDEFRKAALAALRQGSKVMVLDNLNSALKSNTLNQMLTSKMMKGRVLGKTLEINVSTSTLVIATGNNIQIHGDLTRRILTINIAPSMEKPWERVFDQNPLEYIRSHRQQMVSDALTIMRAYQVVTKGHRFSQGGTGSFDQWDNMVRQTICWLISVSKTRDLHVDLADPNLSIDAAIESDPWRNQLKILLKVWPLLFSYPVSVADLVLLANEGENYLNEERDVNDVKILHDVLHDVAGDRGIINSKKLSHYLRKHSRIIVNGCMLVESGENTTGKKLWMVSKD